MAKKSVAGTPADPTVQFTPVVIAGQTYQLAYKFNALAEAERLTGCNLLQGMGGLILGGMTALQFRAMLYAGLQKAYPETTLEQAGDLIEAAMKDGTVNDIKEALLTSYGVSFEKTDPPKADPAAENTGA
jgi:hypothetical protein